jgi:catechol 2,3-dioxygenase-like lactoylglutathione lyase family enzyme
MSTQITEIGTVFVPVSDQERALTFYTEILGFAVRADFEYGGGHRWIEVAPTGAANSLSLVPPGEGTTSPAHRALCALATDDIEAVHARLGDRAEPIGRQGSSRRGLLGDDAHVRDPVPAQFLFRDPDGNRFLIVQPG